MACPKSCLQESLHPPQQFCKVCVWGGGGQYCTPLTDKETEAERSEALSFPGPPGHLICLVPNHSTMGVLPTAGGGGVFEAADPRDDRGFINQRISECKVVKAYGTEALEGDLRTGGLRGWRVGQGCPGLCEGT